MSDEQRYVLGIAYQAGRDERIRMGADGARDYFEPAELEKAAWSYIGSDMLIGVEHIDGTEGHARVVESYIYRGPEWALGDVGGEQVIVKSGDWLLGAVLDDVAWDLYKSGRITGWSPQGSGRRRRPVAKSEGVADIVRVDPVAYARDRLSAVDAQRELLIDIITKAGETP
ncbi:MAG: XkdF-like putative serine protease domain-containing protein [Kofleriaceae bacterium]